MVQKHGSRPKGIWDDRILDEPTDKGTWKLDKDNKSENRET